MGKFRQGATPSDCKCTYNFTCGYCLLNAPPYFFTPDSTEDTVNENAKDAECTHLKP